LVGEQNVLAKGVGKEIIHGANLKT
jgi:hypothetical protein